MNNKDKNIKPSTLYDALLTLKTQEECSAFFDDLCTIGEINAMAQRMEVAIMLSENMVYNEIMAKTGASSATISRVAKCLNHGKGGYTNVLERMTKEQNG